MSWVGPLVVAIGALLAATPVRRWWVRRAWTDPSRDPGASRVGRLVQEAVEALVTSPGDPAEQVAAGLALCEIEEQLSWRAGLRRLLPLADRLDRSIDANALRAELWLGLGEVEQARSGVRALPADHWRACVVRAGLYAIEGDDERAESALVAAAQLSPEIERDRLYERLRARRRRRGLQVGPPLTLWERPPADPNQGSARPPHRVG